MEYLLSGIKEGFCIGFNWVDSAKGSLSSGRKNMYLTQNHPQVVRDYLRDELSRGAVLGPFVPEEVPEVHRFGVIPKYNRSRQNISFHSQLYRIFVWTTKLTE